MGVRKNITVIISLVAVFTVSLCLNQCAHAQETVLVLRNGSTLSGQVEKVGSQFHIRTRSSRLVIEQDKVDFVCNTMADAYDLKFADTAPNDVEGQQKLFYWCLQHHLLPQAQIQIDTILLTDISPAALNHLNRQLTVQIEQENLRLENQQRALQLKSQPAQIAKRIENQPGEVIRQVGYEQVETIPLPSTSQERPNHTTTANMGFPTGKEPSSPPLTELQRRIAFQREIDELAESLPDGVVSKYKRQIESNLVLGCFAAGCHNSDQSKMPLTVIGRYKSVPKRLSQRNLHSILKYVDFEDPLDSQLLRSATQPHGGSAKPIFTEDQVEYSNLKRWLLMFATPEAIAEYQKSELEKQQQAEEQAQIRPLVPQQTVLPHNGEIRQASANLPVDPSMPKIPDINPESVFVPRDPFDPEIFNRKYRSSN